MTQDSQDISVLKFLIDGGADESVGDEPVPLWSEAPFSSRPLSSPAGAEVSMSQAAQAADEAASAARSMAELESAIEKFELCGLAKYATRAVRGTGQQASPGLLIIGEIPGEEDDSLGTAFSGARGELLNSMLDKAGLSLESGVFAMTAIPFRTPGERAPTSEEASVLKPFLVRAIELLAPRAILAMGGLPCEMLCNRDEAIAQIRGEFLDFGGRALMPTFSIDYLLREKAARIKTWDDLKKVIARI